MDLKIDNENGFTIVESILVIAIILISLGIIFFLIDPEIESQKARDSVRLKDAQVFSRAIEEYILDTGNPPDANNTTRTSNALPSGNLGPYAKVNDGWINVNLSSYLSKLPTDPLNTGTYVYRYRRSDDVYEINMVLEFYTSYMTSDNGNSDSTYEVGTSLTLL